MPTPELAWPAGDARNELVIVPHHPDRLRWPPAHASALSYERFQQTLTWNVFRTLELLPPAFWLRRLHARLFGHAPSAAPHVVCVHLWRPLQLPLDQRLDGYQPDVTIDVAIETEHALWALMVANNGRHRIEDASGECLARAIDAVRWRAGSRSSFVGVIETRTSDASVGRILQQRYSRSRASTALRSATRGGVEPSASPGVIQWSDLASILHDCETAPVLADIERALAANAVRWLTQTGQHVSS
jgi:hypothetical protein